MVQLTEPQRKVVEFIFETVRSTGLPPTLREICQHLGWAAVGSAQDVVSALRKKGVLLSPERGKSRQLVLSQWAIDELRSSGETALHRPIPRPVPQPPAGMLWVPMLGQVQAGTPNEAIEHESEKVPFFYPQAGRRPLSAFFALTVEGYSMVNAGFLPGDHLLVERAAVAADRDIVVASTMPGEATVKRFAMRGSELYRAAVESLRSFRRELSSLPPAFLVPENPVFEPIAFGESEQARVLGLVRSLYRPRVD
jgi:repressor LexA